MPDIDESSSPTPPCAGDTARFTGGVAVRVAVHRGDPALAALVARGLQIGPCVELVEETSADRMRLTEGPHGLELIGPGEPVGRGVRADWTWLATAMRRGVGPLRSQPLAKAIGPARTVVDATAGLGDDAMLLAALGCTVVAYERHPVIWALLDDALIRARHNPLIGAVASRVELRQGDAIAAFAAHAEQPAAQEDGQRTPDAIVVDPMFPPRRRRTALPRKGMQVLRRVVGDDPDAVTLLDWALRVAIQRVVVKRLDDGPPLREPVDFTIRSRTVRCDVYRPLPSAPPKATPDGEGT